MKITPSSAKTEPIDRSMPPVMMTKPSPIENMPNRPIRLAVLARFTGDRKRGLMMATTAPTTRIRMQRPRSFFSIGIGVLRRRAGGSVEAFADRELQHIVLAEFGPVQESRDPALMHHGH